MFNQISISDSGILMKEDKMILPESLLKTALHKAHQGGHPGTQAMKRRIRSHFWFPKLDQQIEEMVNNCKNCRMFTSKYKKNPLIAQDLRSRKPWEKVSIDLFGPMPDKKHVVVVQDMVSRFPAAKIVNDTNADNITKTLKEVYSNFGVPKVQRTDNGPPFNSSKFKEFSEGHGITHELAFPYHPQANCVESFMKPLGKTMKTAHHDHQNKTNALEELLSSYRATPHYATGIPPGDMMFRYGYNSIFPKSKTTDDNQIQAALKRDFESRLERNTKINEGRNDEQTKYQPAVT